MLSHEELSVESMSPMSLETQSRNRGVKLTGYRILNVSLIVTLGLSKAVLSYQGQSVAPTTFEWVSGVVVAIGMYLLGLYENVDPPVLLWLLHNDYSPQLFQMPTMLYNYVIYKGTLMLSCVGLVNVDRSSIVLQSDGESFMSFS